MAKRFRYKHITSAIENKEPDVLLDGEIAVNKFAGKEKLFIKNSNNEVISFSSDSNFYTKSEIDDAEETIATALNYLYEEMGDIETLLASI